MRISALTPVAGRLELVWSYQRVRCSSQRLRVQSSRVTVVLGK